MPGNVDSLTADGGCAAVRQAVRRGAAILSSVLVAASGGSGDTARCKAVATEVVCPSGRFL